MSNVEPARAATEDADTGARGPHLASLVDQGFRFALAGGTVALVYLGITTLLSDVLRVPFQAALAVGFTVGLAVHFTLQRVFVWSQSSEYALRFHHQVGRYLLAAGIQYGLTALSTAILPAALGLRTEIVYLATVALLASSNFLIFRQAIFHAPSASRTADGVSDV